MTNEQNKMIEDNYDLVVSCIKVMKAYPIEDYTGLASIALCEAAIDYKSCENTKFRTFAANCIKNKLKDEFRKNTRLKDILNNPNIVSLDYMVDNSIYDYDICTYEFENELISNIFINLIREQINEKKFFIFQKILEGYNKTEISEQLRCSRPNVSKICTEIKNILNIFKY